MNEVAFDVYGVSLRLRSPLDSFVDFVSRNYSQFDSGQGPRIDVDVEYSESAGRHAAGRRSDLRFFGGGVYLGPDSIYWENEFGFRVLVTIRNDGTVGVRAFHHDLLGKSDAEERFKDFQRSLRWAIHFPVFTLLQYRRGWTLVHASAVVRDGTALAFCGLNGVGKSTIAMYLCQEHGYELMTDNFLFVGESAMHGFPEVLRLSPEAAESTGLSSLWGELVYGKHHVAPEELGVTLESPPTTFFMVNQADDLVTRTLPPARAWETMDRLHSFLGEFPEQSYLGFWPYVTGETMNTDNATRTMTNTPWYELSYEPDWDLDAIATEVERCI